MGETSAHAGRGGGADGGADGSGGDGGGGGGGGGCAAERADADRGTQTPQDRPSGGGRGGTNNHRAIRRARALDEGRDGQHDSLALPLRVISP